jgi:tetratricopeptide (TPR) repeat protein
MTWPLTCASGGSSDGLGVTIEQAPSDLTRATTMLDLGRYHDASQLLARVVAAEPDSSRAWCLFARAHLGAGRYQPAVDAANRAVSIDPGEEWPHRLASNALMHLGQHREALRAATEARRLAPSYWQTHVCVAQAALAAAHPAIASAAAAEARRLAPDEADVHFLSGKVSLARGDLTAARDHQERALSIDPGHSGAMNELGRIRLRKHDPSGAIRHFISAARTTPDEHIYSRNIDVVILRSISRTIYLFTAITLSLIWVPSIVHMSRFPYLTCLAVLLAATLASFTFMLARMPREARPVVRRTLRTRRVLLALALAGGGVAAAFAAVTLTPEADLPQMLPLAALITFGVPIVSKARLRAPLRGTRSRAKGLPPRR